jgi:hypothetical protein
LKRVLLIEVVREKVKRAHAQAAAATGLPLFPFSFRQRRRNARRWKHGVRLQKNALPRVNKSLRPTRQKSFLRMFLLKKKRLHHLHPFAPLVASGMRAVLVAAPNHALDLQRVSRRVPATEAATSSRNAVATSSRVQDEQWRIKLGGITWRTEHASAISGGCKLRALC